ncbi:hypothetical protein GR925_13730 [Streptomyces sp. HUCO-GS316]|uniref:hypothetical protein n=1 Tax=Streptomyces sp. HUCO-GS316 TaxID=2692198 RepID=UPI00136DD31D|nr:hypothetical protein [Streptomyces sp. HUCO-GS316]MXM64479.1 hypothetical protein [Streptomyces sp. HUCO-GS316]
MNDDMSDLTDVSAVNDDVGEGLFGDMDFDTGPLEEELRRAAAILDPVPAELRQIAVEAFALHDLDARIAELTFDSVVDAIPVRGATSVPRMLTFHSGDVTVDVEVSTQGLLGQVLPPQSASIEVLSGPQAALPLVADDMGRFTSDVSPAGPFALRLRTAGEVVVTEWLRA